MFARGRRVDGVLDGVDVDLRMGAIVHESIVARRMSQYRHVLVAAPALLERLGARIAARVSVAGAGVEPPVHWRRLIENGPWRGGNTTQ